MFESDAFEKRERALEDEFFHRVDEKLKADLRKSIERDASRKALTESTGLQDPALIEKLLDAGLEATTLAALALVPAVYVAWADHHVTDAERKAVLDAAEQRGIASDSVASKLLQSWLEHPPKKDLWQAWKQCAADVGKGLPQETSELLFKDVTEIAETVAKASGGVLGIGKISSNERAVLDDIKATLKAES